MVISKSAQKVLNKVDKPTAKKLNKALTNIQNNIGYIEPLKQIQRGMEDNLYRYKMEHYRIIFKRTLKELTIKSITTKSNTKFRRTGCMQYLKTSVVMNLSERSVFSGRIKVQKIEPGLNCSAQDIRSCCKPYSMNSELSRCWAG